MGQPSASSTASRFVGGTKRRPACATSNLRGCRRSTLPYSGVYLAVAVAMNTATSAHAERDEALLEFVGRTCDDQNYWTVVVPCVTVLLALILGMR